MKICFSKRNFFLWVFVALVVLVGIITLYGNQPAVSTGSNLTVNVIKDKDKDTNTAQPNATHEVFKTNNKTIDVYNHRISSKQNMNIEEYIKGVVAAEMTITFEMEALKAQAITARTYAYEKILNGGGCSRQGCDVCTDYTHCQAYNDVAARKKEWGKNFETYEQKLNTAVMTTAGDIITYDSKPILALFHSSSGGNTEDCAKVFNDDLPYLKSVTSPGEEDALRYNTQKTVSKATFFNKTNSKVNSMDQVKISDRTASNRVVTMTVGDKKLKGTTVRSLFGLYSTNFNIVDNGDTITFNAIGYGHGVGLSQVGANAMAKKSDTYEKIIKHYFTGVEIESMNK